MKRKLNNYALIFLQIVISVNACGFYSIIAPGTIQSNYKYSVSVTLHENSEPTTIKVGIVGPSMNETKIVKVLPKTTKLLNFNVPKLKEGTYTLETEGINGLLFKNSSELNFGNKDPKIYIQTNKAIYKPGDLVQYRIIVLDEQAKPAKLENAIKLEFKDAAGNFIKQINDVHLNKGVYVGELQLAVEPVLGTWSMKAILESSNVYKEMKFKVDKYILPKFSLDIEMTRNIYYKDPVKVLIRSKYTYGKPVKGQATITVTSKYGKLKLEKTIEVDGKGYGEFKLDNIFELADAVSIHDELYHMQPIKIFVNMSEEYTGNNCNKTTTAYIYRSRYNIIDTGYVHEFVVNKTFDMQVHILNLDGSPVQNGKEMAKLRINKNSKTANNSKDFEFTSALDKNGRAVFKVTLPETGYYYQIRAMYGDREENLSSLRGKGKEEEVIGNAEENERTLELNRLTQQNSKFVEIEVKSNKAIPYYVYSLIARGNIIIHKYIKLGNNIKSHKIKFKPSFEMVPEAYLYVYFVLDSELQYKELPLKFPEEFLNKIEINAPKLAKPNEEVTVNIKTDPDSFVGLLAVDQSVLLLKSDNDFNSMKILNGLRSYDSFTPHAIDGYGPYPGRMSGLVTLTNANYDYNPENIVYEDDTMYEYDVPNTAPTTTSKNEPDSPYIRSNFEEVWIYETFNTTDAKGLIAFTKKMPDTITSWVLTGFSLNSKTGFGMTANPTNIEVFQPFFISTNLPYSVKRGEVISIPIIIFNYMDKTLDAEVIMENTDKEYVFIKASNDIEELVLKEKQSVKHVTVASNSGQTTTFMIRPNKVGEISLKIKAITPLAGDAIHQKLKVEAEGVTQYGNEAIFLTPSKEPVKHIIKAKIPKDAVLESEYLEFSVVGDILGPTIKNIDKLVRKPSGCGEQNMINFVPNIMVLHYLDAIKYVMPSVVQKAKNFMEIGYQHELTFKHKNGAFSAFGEGNSEPSSWLTAYVARSFIRARKYITIDEKIIQKALEYVVSVQLESGQFQQTGRLLHPVHQNDLGFTAFALLALFEDVNYSNKYHNQIQKGIKYIVENIDKEDDIYALSIAVDVLQKIRHSKAKLLLKRLEKLAQEKNGLKWWTQTSNDINNDIEITAYILEASLYTEPAGRLLPIMKWLISNRNSRGGFDSSQGTVVGLQALVSFAKKYVGSPDGKMNINYMARDAKVKEVMKGNFSINKDNSLMVQTHVLPKSSREIYLEAYGDSSSLIQLSYRYNLAKKIDDKPSFAITQEILSSALPKILAMEVCVEFVPNSNYDLKESNMAIMEISLPSGFTADTNKFEAIFQTDQVQRIETKNSETLIIIYFDYLIAGKEECFKVHGEKTHNVAKQKPAAITMYDYYNSEQQATIYYDVKSSLCDICEEDQCGKGCQKKSVY